MNPQTVAPQQRAARPAHTRLFAAAALIVLASCAQSGRLQPVEHKLTPVVPDSTVLGTGTQLASIPIDLAFRPLFGDTIIGLVPGSGDSTKRFLGRLREGYTVDTLNIFLCGDNRPGFRLSRIRPSLQRIKQGISWNPLKIARGIVNIPVAFVKGMFPDFALLHETPGYIGHKPKWGREQEVLNAMIAKVDSMQAQGKQVAAVINAGDLVQNGQIPAQWERFLRITEPLSSRVPYFPVAGNHERTDTEAGVENWRVATGLPVGSDRLYYCFDSADGWVRFIALDTNPIVNAGNHWTREAQIAAADEQFTWLVARVREHRGPVLVLMHHPPFSAGYHRVEWQWDDVLVQQRERMVRSLYEVGISIVVAGHEHAYQRALLTWPDAALIYIVSGGAGSPLHDIPPPAESARLFSDYKVAGAVVKPENVFTSQVFNFSHLRLWFGGGQLITYAVDEKSNITQIDELEVDLNRWGVPKIDQHKRPIPEETGPQEPPADATAPAEEGAPPDSAASDRLLDQPPPGKK